MNNSGPYAHGDQSRGKSTTVSVTCWPRLARTHCLSTAPAQNCRWSGSRNWMVACADFPYVQLSPALSVPGGLARFRSRYGCAHSANPCPSEWRERRGCCMTGYTPRIRLTTRPTGKKWTVKRLEDHCDSVRAMNIVKRLAGEHVWFSWSETRHKNWALSEGSNWG
jgi:hypothetical protein